MNKIGALWLNTSKKGVRYFAGSVKVMEIERKIIIFKNTQKQEGEKYPDYIIYGQDPKEQRPKSEAVPNAPNEEVPF